MLTNFLLELILGVVITSFIILNNKINRTEFNTKFIIDGLKRIDKFVEANNLVINNIQDRFNNKALKDSEHWSISEDYYNNIITLLKSRFKDIDNATDSIYDRINTIDSDTQTLIVAEHRITRSEIKKLAKISSKKKSQLKTNKSINHKQKCE